MKSAVLPGMFATGLETGPREQDTETRRRLSAKDRILARLKEGPASNVELNEICFRFGGRIHELRAEGYRIHTEDMGRGRVHYTLTRTR